MSTKTNKYRLDRPEIEDIVDNQLAALGYSHDTLDEVLGGLVQITAGEQVAVADGIATDYSGALGNLPAIRGSVAFTDGVESFADNGDGTLLGSNGGSGTIDYRTGAWALSFAAPPAGAAPVTAGYDWAQLRTGAQRNITIGTTAPASPLPDDIWLDVS